MTKQRRVVKNVKRKTQIVKRIRNSYEIEHKKKVIAYAKTMEITKQQDTLTLIVVW